MPFFALRATQGQAGSGKELTIDDFVLSCDRLSFLQETRHLRASDFEFSASHEVEPLLQVSGGICGLKKTQLRIEDY